jgi:hypothetical protein
MPSGGALALHSPTCHKKVKAGICILIQNSAIWDTYFSPDEDKC